MDPPESFTGDDDKDDAEEEEEEEEEKEDEETPIDVAGFCQVCHPGVGLGFAVVTFIFCVEGLLAFVLFASWTAAPQVTQTSASTGLIHRLQQCQKQSHELDLMLQTISQDSRCSLCPQNWIWWKNHCYFFSVGLQEDLQWNESVKFCGRHNSSLAVIKDTSEMDFVQTVMRKFPQFPFLWVGLTDSRQEGRWLWLDGADVQHYMPGLSVEWDSDHRDCADLRGNSSLFAADCDMYGPWVCTKEF